MDANLICVVDDEASIIDFVSLYLKREGFSVIGYLDGGNEKGVGLGLSISTTDRLCARRRDHRNE